MEPMHPISDPIRLLVGRPWLLIVLVFVGACLAVVTIAVACALLTTMTPVDGPLMGPFRWPPNHVGLA
jgi:hypothetical protein